MSINDFHDMTLKEIGNAQDGFNRKAANDVQWSLYSARLVSYYACAPHQGKNPKIKRPTDLFELDIDKELKRQRLKKLRPIKVINSGESNG